MKVNQEKTAPPKSRDRMFTFPLERRKKRRISRRQMCAAVNRTPHSSMMRCTHIL